MSLENLRGEVKEEKVLYVHDMSKLWGRYRTPSDMHFEEILNES